MYILHIIIRLDIFRYIIVKDTIEVKVNNILLLLLLFKKLLKQSISNTYDMICIRITNESKILHALYEKRYIIIVGYYDIIWHILYVVPHKKHCMYSRLACVIKETKHSIVSKNCPCNSTTKQYFFLSPVIICMYIIRIMVYSNNNRMFILTEFPNCGSHKKKSIKLNYAHLPFSYFKHTYL
jgi:hypothetical protein